MNKSSIIELANELIDEAESCDPRAICSHLGITINVGDLQELYATFHLCMNHKIISLNNRLQSLDKVFVLSHELKHALTESDDDSMMISDYFVHQNSLHENEANFFASYILLRYVAELGDHSEYLSPHFAKIVEKYRYEFYSPSSDDIDIVPTVWSYRKSINF